MDDSSQHVDRRLLDPSTFVRPESTVPLRHPNQTFKEFNSNSGTVVTQGSSDHQFDNPRIFSKYRILLIQHLLIIFIRPGGRRRNLRNSR